MADGPKDFWQTHMRALFDRMRADSPVLLDGTTPLGLGSHGMVVDHNDGTVSKIFLRGDNPEKQDFRQKIYDNETHVLHLLDGAAFAGAKTPAVLDETRLPESRDAFASYRMPKAEGRELNWQRFCAIASEADIASHFSHVGAVLAEFHDKAQVLSSVTAQLKPIDSGVSVDPIPGLGAEANKALAACDKYLRAHMQPGIIHGDFHPKNFMVDDSYAIAGLFDMSFSGMGKNFLVDLAGLPEKGLPYALDEYERHGGRPVDTVMLTLTQISVDAAKINWTLKNTQQNPAAVAEALESLTARLNKVQDITGVAFSEVLEIKPALQTKNERGLAP